MARILILREAKAARAVAALVESFGDTPLLLPTRWIEALDPPAPVGPFGGLLVTSANAAPYLARHAQWRALPVLAVGPATADALAASGFERVETGPGTAEGLVAPAIALHRKTDLPLLYLAGAVRRPDLEAGLEAARVPLTSVEVYRDCAREPSLAEIEAAFAAGPPDAVLLLSRGQAEDFLALRRRFPGRLGGAPMLLCLSPRIAAVLAGSGDECVIATEKPELSALLARYRSSRESGVD